MYLLDPDDCKKATGGIIGAAAGFVIGAAIATPVLFLAAASRSGMMTYESFKFTESMENLAKFIINTSVSFGNAIENKISGAPSEMTPTASSRDI